MGALRINLTNGTHSFINLDNANSVSVKESSNQNFIIVVDEGQPTEIEYTVERFNSDANAASYEITWREGMEVAYKMIATSPIKYGYPLLGSDYKDYVQYDDEKFLSSAIDSALSNTSEPAVLSNRTAIFIGAKDNTDTKSIVADIASLLAACEAAAATEKTACITAVTDPACVAPGFALASGVSCACEDEACCEANALLYVADCMDTALDAIGPIEWKHQYLFENVTSGAGPK